MLDAYKILIINQFEAAFCTLNACIDQCPDDRWDEPVVNNPFCQTVFHTLFYTDYYLGPNAESFREQPFHRANKSFFRDYEELEDREAKLRYEKADVRRYLQFCRDKAAEIINSETTESLTGPSGFERRKCSRAELHVYNIRHIQHHAAHLSMRLRIDTGDGIAWYGSGWSEPL